MGRVLALLSSASLLSMATICDVKCCNVAVSLEGCHKDYYCPVLKTCWNQVNLTGAMMFITFNGY